VTRSVRRAELMILDAIDSPSIWGGWFRDPATWRPWRTFLSALFGLPVGGEGRRDHPLPAVYGLRSAPHGRL
jgi:hypothetical protein